MARSMVSRGILAWRAAIMAARSRGLALGSAWPVLAATVNSRMILVKTLARFASSAPFRFMMFLNCECPAFGRPRYPIEDVSHKNPTISRAKRLSRQIFGLASLAAEGLRSNGPAALRLVRFGKSRLGDLPILF